MKKIYNILPIITLVFLILINTSCGPDLADNPIINVEKVDTLQNGVEMKIDGKEWKSNSIAKCQYFPGGIQVDAALWDSTSKVTETINFFLKDSNVGTNYKIYPFEENNNIAYFRYFPFSSPLPSKSYDAYDGNVELTFIDTNRIKGTFNLVLKDSMGTILNITDGKFSIKFLKD